MKEWPRMIQFSETNVDQKLQVHHLWRAYGLQSLKPNESTTKRTGRQPERDTTWLRFLIQIPSNFNFVIGVVLTWCLQCSEVWTFFCDPGLRPWMTYSRRLRTSESQTPTGTFLATAFAHSFSYVLSYFQWIHSDRVLPLWNFCEGK